MEKKAAEESQAKNEIEQDNDLSMTLSDRDLKSKLSCLQKVM